MDDAKTPPPAAKAGDVPTDGPKADAPAPDARRPAAPKLPREIGGAPGPEPTRYGDWQHKGRVSDF